MRKTMEKKAENQGFSLKKYAASDTRRENAIWYLAKNGRIFESFETLLNVDDFLSSREDMQESLL